MLQAGRRAPHMDSAGEAPALRVQVLSFVAGVEHFGDPHRWRKKGCERRPWVDLLQGDDTYYLGDPTTAKLWVKQVELLDLQLVTPPCGSF